MNDFTKITFMFAAFMAAVPIAAGLISARETPAPTEQTEASSEAISDKPIYRCRGGGTFRILNESEGTVTEIALRDYVIGAVMAEMPYTYPEEALKAQAVAAATYAVRRTEEQLSSPSAELCGAYISDDPMKYQCCLTEEQGRSMYGDEYEAAYEKISAAADAVSDTILIYNGEPIIAAFHSISCGVTESAENVWGENIPYLIPAESTADISAENYEHRFCFTSAEIKARLSTKYPEIEFSDDTAEKLSAEYTPSGYVKNVTAGDFSLSGRDFSRIFSLPSASFDIEYSEGHAAITSKGAGHGVGMSQNGARSMAENNCTYEDILLHYYTGAELAIIEFADK